jgi:uncharacterized membrane protein
MMETILTWLQGFPPELVAAILAALPVLETRVALPVAIFALDLPPMTAFVSTFMGNLFPVPFIFFFLTPVLAGIHRHVPRLDQWFLVWRAKQEKKFGASYSKWGAFFLFLIVVIPGPGTGVWTASALAVLFQIDLRLSALSIAGAAFVG